MTVHHHRFAGVDTAAPPLAARHPERPALVGLFLGAFAIGCTEFVVVGLLSLIADGFAVSEAAAGQLVTLNAVAVAVGAPVLAAATARLPRRAVLLAALAVFTVSHAVAALAPTFAVLLATRLVSGASFGLYIAVAIGTAGRLVPEQARARAMATVVAGVSTATALGVPLGTLLGQNAGWRLPFAAIGALAVVAAVTIARTLPDLPAVEVAPLRTRLAALRTRPVALGIAAIVAFWAASFSAYTYLVPLLAAADVTGSAVTVVLFATGVAAVAGNVLGGRSADAHVRATLLVTTAVTVAALLLLGPATAAPVTAVVLVVVWQVAAWSYVPAAQAAVAHAAGPQAETAVSFTVSAFNVGIVVGAAAGGLALDTAGLSGVTILAAALGLLTAALVVAALPARHRASA